jgi:DNA processing protein
MTRSSLVLPSPPRVLRPEDPVWPAGLAQLRDPPSQLRLAGNLPLLTGAIAVVGTRHADSDALELAREIAADLVAAGRTVISGGAVGIDAAAHRGALEMGGSTIAVLATGFDVVYPPSHGALFSEIAVHGALVTEQNDGCPPVAWAFLARNRLIAALAEAVVVVQAPLRSGALSTARLANMLKKPVFAVPYAPWQVRGEGCLALLRGGAYICTSARDVLSVRPHRGDGGVGPDSNHGEKDTDFKDLDEDARAVLGALGPKACHPDKLAAELGLPIIRIQQALLELLLLGVAVERGPGSYARNAKPKTR